MRFSVQSYRSLLFRLRGMLRDLESILEPNEMQKFAKMNLREQVDEYSRKLQIFGNVQFFKRIG